MSLGNRIKPFAGLLFFAGGATCSWFLSPLDWADGCLLFGLGMSAGIWDAELNLKRARDEVPFTPWDEMDVEEKRAYFGGPLAIGFAGVFVFAMAFLAPDASLTWKIIGCAFVITGLAVFLAHRRWKRRFGI
jgi:hypothetical protein